MEKLIIFLLIGFTLIQLGSGNSYTRYTPEELLAIKQVNLILLICWISNFIQIKIRHVIGDEYSKYNGPLKTNSSLVGKYQELLKTNGFIIHIIRAQNGDVQNSIQMIRDVSSQIKF